MIAAGRDRRVAMGKAGREKMEREFDKKIIVDAYRQALAAVAST